MEEQPVIKNFRHDRRTSALFGKQIHWVFAALICLNELRFAASARIAHTVGLWFLLPADHARRFRGHPGALGADLRFW
jgi:hypothetical protein